ncbi:Endocytosis and vacuole integrity protein [Ascochyta rabiei]|uniref:Endocytosis and vacuole integrity protein n=1 Tax=Didymella rabiei TaxID=5454 RepID=UPI00220F39BF|nr:Endocytosis and vacuole integrity protein [Ascochyta rabiei]UPX10963.1 Endocytosis and vacuole integrity protein [Ascochyta rabiei]
MTAQILAAELANLISDSKRKNTELRTAAEKALQDLKSLSNTSEAQLSADLSRRPHFCSPFLIACGTHNAKFTSTAVSCLQRLSVSRALPRERLSEVLEAFRESAASSHDIQLKILQALPSLLQNYPSEIRGELLSTVLQICSGLQNAKNPAVSNTAAATLQQLVIAIFDRVTAEDGQALEIPTVTEVKGDDGLIPVRPAANDAYKVFNDLNLLVTGEKPAFIRFSTIPPASILELIEAVLSNYGQIMVEHTEQVYILRTLLMPLIIRSLSDRLSFPIIVRIIRILNLIIRNHLTILPSECEIALGLLNHMLDPEASQLWKRALCLEVFRGIYADSRLLLAIYHQFDAQDGKKKIFGDNLASFVRLATEKPALIGLGQQSTAPMSFVDDRIAASEQAAAAAGAMAGDIGGPISDRSSSSRPYGISTQWSSMKTPCIDQLDKSDPPVLPDTYIYSLVLTCITNISESLAKFVLPLTVHHDIKSRRKTKTDDPAALDSEETPADEGGQRLSRTQSFRKKTIPVNPLDLSDHPAYAYIQTSLTLTTECWPAILATCSTFLNASLDVEYYRALVRAIQKFTQVAGLLRMATPRDAFLTTMGKAAIPSNLLLANVSSPKAAATDQTGMFNNAKGLLSVDSLVSQASSASTEHNRRPSHDVQLPSLGPRNLLCLRALLNLAIALGPTLQSAWSIVFETLQVADLVLSLSNHNGGRSTAQYAGPEGAAEKMEAETAAVQAAARRLFESTVDFPNDSFSEVLQALCALLNNSSPIESGQMTPTTAGRPQILHQRRLGSVSGISLNTGANSRDAAFALNKIGELAALNEARLSQYDPSESGWDTFVNEIVRFSADDRKAPSSRLLAADILSRTVREIAEISMYDEQREQIQARILATLQRQITVLRLNDIKTKDVHSDTDIRVHQTALDALKNVIEQCGESLVAGWASVLDSLLSVFLPDDETHEGDRKTSGGPAYRKYDSRVVRVISRSLARSAFATVQLVCSDFLASVPDACLSTLLELLLNFCGQQDDLNMSLTAITFFWNVSDFLQSRSDISSLPNVIGDVLKSEEIRALVKTNSKGGNTPTLWLQVLLDLSTTTTDKRAEVRNSAVQTIQRIFENYTDQLSSDAWMLCLRAVLFEAIEANLAAQKNVRHGSHNTANDIESWNETTKTVLQSVSTLTTMRLQKIDDTSTFGGAWTDLLDRLQQYFAFGSHALGSYVFVTITSMLSNLNNAQVLGASSLHKTAVVWTSYLDSHNTWGTDPGDNQEAFVAFADAFKAIYRLAGQSIDADLPSMLSHLETCVMESDAIAYSSDVDAMTPLQTSVLECLSIVDTTEASLPSYMIGLLGRFSVLPYTSGARQSEIRGPTFVALSKTSMAMLQDIIVKHIGHRQIYTDGAFSSAVTYLARPIQEKYAWQKEGKPPTIWRKATTTAIAILHAGLPQLEANQITGQSLNNIWTAVVDIAYYITRAHHLNPDVPPPSLDQDEEFDIKSFTELRQLITTPLNAPSLPDSLRRAYTRNLFSVSLIHTPLQGELSDLASTPLNDLYKIRLGQTAVLPATLRTKMSYTCISELFNLVSAHDNSNQCVKLAQAAAPYLILRAAVPLKTYVADHPLRGRMPAPDSQRKELLQVLSKLEALESEPLAIPDAPGVKSKHRKHLQRLYPLLLKAMRVARHDHEVFEKLVALTEIVGDEFGMDDE